METGRGETSARRPRSASVLPLFGCLAGLLIPVSSAFAAYPGANGRIIYSTGRGPSYGVHTILPSGRGDTVIGHSGGQFSWSPSGRRIVFVDDPGPNIYTMRTNGGDVRQLTFDGGNYAPQYSPRGYRIAFIHFGNVSTAITVMHSDGTDRHRVATGSFRGWTPDGRIAYGCPSGLCVMDGNGTHRTRLVRLGSAGGDGPFYSPDGSKFIFTRCRETASHSVDCTGFIANADGTDIKTAPCDLHYANAYSPGMAGGRIPLTYSPDGHSLLVGVPFINNDADFTENLLIVSLRTCKGTRVAVRTHGDADWQPLPNG